MFHVLLLVLFKHATGSHVSPAYPSPLVYNTSYSFTVAADQDCFCGSSPSTTTAPPTTTLEPTTPAPSYTMFTESHAYFLDLQLPAGSIGSFYVDKYWTRCYCPCESNATCFCEQLINNATAGAMNFDFHTYVFCQGTPFPNLTHDLLFPKTLNCGPRNKYIGSVRPGSRQIAKSKAFYLNCTCPCTCDGECFCTIVPDFVGGAPIPLQISDDPTCNLTTAKRRKRQAGQQASTSTIAPTTSSISSKTCFCPMTTVVPIPCNQPLPNGTQYYVLNFVITSGLTWTDLYANQNSAAFATLTGQLNYLITQAFADSPLWSSYVETMMYQLTNSNGSLDVQVVLQFNATLPVCYINCTNTIAESFYLGFPLALSDGAFGGNLSIDTASITVFQIEFTSTSSVYSPTTPVIAAAAFNQWIILGIAGAVLLAVLISTATILILRARGLVNLPQYTKWMNTVIEDF